MIAMTVLNSFYHRMLFYCNVHRIDCYKHLCLNLSCKCKHISTQLTAGIENSNLSIHKIMLHKPIKFREKKSEISPSKMMEHKMDYFNYN